MFDVRELFDKWAKELAAEENDRRRDEHIGALKNWARRVNEQNSKEAPPVSPFRVLAVVNLEAFPTYSLKFVETEELASYLDPKKFINIHPLDNPDFGDSPVGLPIPEQVNRYYMSSKHTAKYVPGRSVTVVGDRAFKFKSEGFTQFWEEVL